MEVRQVKCTKCGHVAPETDFPKGRDFFQNEYVAECPKKCGNRQNPGDASMRMFSRPGPPPFEYVRAAPLSGAPIDTMMHRAGEAR